MPVKKNSCSICRGLFTPHHNNQKYCSKECRKEGVRRYHNDYCRRRRNSFTKHCENCGNPIPNRDGNRFCSKPECNRIYIRQYMNKRYHIDLAFRKQTIQNSTKYYKNLKNNPSKWQEYLEYHRIWQKKYNQKRQEQKNGQKRI